MNSIEQSASQKPVNDALIVEAFKKLVKKTKHSKEYIIAKKLTKEFECSENYIKQVIKKGSLLKTA